MKRICTLMFTLLLNFVLTIPAFSFQNEPDGFRNYPWQTDKNNLSSPGLLENLGSSQTYAKTDDDLMFEGFPATSIIYGFTDDKLTYGLVEFENKDVSFLARLKERLINVYGQGEAVGADDMMWNGEKTHIKFGRTADGAEIFFDDMAKSRERQKQMDAFLERLEKKWHEAYGKEDIARAEKEIREWIDQEGRDIVASYRFDPKREIDFVFKGVGGYLWSPKTSPAFKLESDKIYSVSEAYRILTDHPELLKQKDIIIKAAIVNGVGGMGCNDYEMIADVEITPLYLRQYDKDLTAEEKDTIKKAPLIVTSSSSQWPGKPPSLREGDVLFFQGHFFDPALKGCKDGWRRFAVTGIVQR